MSVDTTTPIIDLGEMTPTRASQRRHGWRTPLLVGAVLAAFGLGYLTHSQPLPEPPPPIPAGCGEALAAAGRYIGAYESAGSYVDGLLRDTAQQYRDAVRSCPTSG